MTLPMGARCVALAAAALSCGASAARAADVAANWLQPVAGNWTDASKWSSDPFFPNNGTPAGAVYDASITASGAPYSVQLAQDVAVRNLTLGGSAELLISHPFANSTLTVDQQLSLGAGSRLLLRRGRISGGTLAGAGYAEVDAFSDAFLNNVALAGEVRVPSTAHLYFQGSTSFAGGVVRLTGQQNDLNVGAAITGTGEVVFDGAGFEFGNVRAPNTGVMDVPIAAGITIRTGTSSGELHGSSEVTFVNDGNIRSETGRALHLRGNFRNRNVVHAANGGTIKLANWTNTGSVTAQGGTIQVFNIPAAADLGTFFVHDGRFELEGTSTLARVHELDIANSIIAVGALGRLDLQGATLPVADGTNTWRLASGSLSNGTLTGGPGSGVPLRVERRPEGDSLLMNLQLQADVEMDPGVRLALQDVTVAAGRTLRMGGPSGSTFGRLTLRSSSTWGGSRVVFDGASAQNLLEVEASAAGIATIPAGAEVVTGTGGGTIFIPFGVTGSLVNAGTIAAPTAGRTIMVPGKFTNHGRIAATAGDVRTPLASQPQPPPPGDVTSGGSIELGPAGDFDVYGKLTLLDSNIAEFAIGGTGVEEFGQLHATTLTLGGSLRASLANGFEPDLGQSFTIASVDAGGSVSGVFDATEFPTWVGGRTFAVNYSPTAVTLTVVVPEPATAGAAVAMLSIAARCGRRGRRERR